MGYIKFAVVKLIVSFHILFFVLFFYPRTIYAEHRFNINLLLISNFSFEDEPGLDFDEKSSIDTANMQNAHLADAENVDSLSSRSLTENLGNNTVSSSPESQEDHLNNSVLSVFFSQERMKTLEQNLIDYGNNHLPRKLRLFYFAVIEKSFEYSIIFLLVSMILIFMFNIILVFLILNYTIQRKNYKERFEFIYRKMYEEVLMAYIFGSIDWDKAVIKLKRINKPENRKILIAVLMNFKANFKGEMEHFFPEIYTKLGLHEDSIREVHSYHDYKKVRGIMELTHLYPEGAKGLINKLINDPNDYVRAEAQIAYVRLNPEHPFDFFYKLEKPFSKWTQLSVFYLIRLNQIPVPSFAKFLNFKHFNIRNFSLMMITFFQQFENVSEVIEMVESNLERTRFLAYRAIDDLRLYDSRELIKMKFRSETHKNKLEILKTLRNIGDNDDFEFLVEVMKTESVSFKIEACRSIYFMSQATRERIMQEKNDSIQDLELLLAHVTDPRN